MSIPVPGVLETVDLDLSGSGTNVPTDVIRDQIASSIRRGYPQLVQQAGTRPERIVLLGSGPSLNDDEAEIVRLVHDGAHLVTVNGSYHWALARNLKPHVQVILDARADNARFLSPAAPRCAYLLASQCHPAVWNAVEGRDDVWIWHPVTREHAEIAALLDGYYLSRWAPVMGGCTVISRALWLLRMQGYLRFDLFGVDCCWRGDAHHAFDQPENAADVGYTVRIEPPAAPELGREFRCSLWMLKQFEDLLSQIRTLGDHFLLRVHGDGLLAYALQTAGDLESVTVTQE